MFEQAWLIDDDPINNLLCEALLLKTGFARKVRSFESAAPALEALGVEDWPEWIFLDLNMPGLSGWDFLDRFAELAPSAGGRARVVILSSSIDPGDTRRAEQYADVEAYFSKPLTQEALGGLGPSKV